MARQRDFRVIEGSITALGKEGTDPEIVLCLRLVKGFRLLSHENKLKAIEIVEELSHAPLSNKS